MKINVKEKERGERRIGKFFNKLAMMGKMMEFLSQFFIIFQK